MMKIVNWLFNHWGGGLVLATIACTTGNYITTKDKVEFANTYIEGVKLCEEESKSQCLLMVVPMGNLKGVQE